MCMNMLMKSLFVRGGRSSVAILSRMSFNTTKTPLKVNVFKVSDRARRNAFNSRRPAGRGAY